MLEKNKESWEIEFDKKFDWKDCGDFKISLDNQTVRPCYKCGFDTMFCKNCANDHHIENRDKCIKQWIYSTLSNQRSEIVESIRKLCVNTPEEVKALNANLPSTVQEEQYYKAKGWWEAVDSILALLNSKDN